MIFRIFLTTYIVFSILIAHGEEHDHDHNHNHEKQKYKSTGIVRGSVIDDIVEDKKAYANISVVKENSDDIVAGGITDNNGLFLIDKVPVGKYFLVVQYIGSVSYTHLTLPTTPYV